MAKKSFLFLSTLLLLTATSSIAMSLGLQSGVTLVGQPLDIAVQAALEARDDAESLCLEAEVFYGDNRLDKSRVRVTLEKSAAAPQQALIRIRSAVLIDEPVVTLYLRAGCQLKTERRYVSLAELATETTPDRSSSVPLPAPRLAPLPMVNVPGNAASNAATLEGSPLAPKNSNLARGSSSQRTPVAARGTKAAEPAKARLKLEPLDLVMERDSQLKASAELLSIPAANPLERAAASALWRALSAQPQDILRETEKLQVLENSVRNLQTQSQKALAAIDDLNGKLQQAQAERYSNALVYALAILLLAAMAGLAYLFRTKFVHQSGESGDKPWWRKNDANQGHKKAWLDSLSSHHPEESSSSRLPSAQMLAPTGVDVDIDLDFTGSGPAGVRPADTKNLVNAVPVESKKKFGFVLPGIDPISLSGSKTGSVTDNLIDFDVFDVPSV